jgi:hypothetical protein
VLEHHRHARGARRTRLGRRIGRAQQRHASGVGPHESVDGLDQGALARAVLAQERVDGARMDVEAHVAVGDDARIGLGEAPDGQERVSHPAASLSRDSLVSALISAAATPTAMAWGCLPRPGSPIGQAMRAIWAGAWPRAASRARNRAILVRDPISPRLANPCPSSAWQSWRSSSCDRVRTRWSASAGA